VLTAVAAALARAFLTRWIGGQVSILIFVPAIAFSAWFGGFLPGMLTTLLSAAAHLLLVPDFPGLPAMDPRTEEIRIILLVGTGALLSMLYGSLRVGRRGFERRYNRAQLMLEATRRLSGSLVAEEIHDELRELVGRAIPFDGMVVSSYDPDSHVARCVYGWVNGRKFDPSTLPPITIDPEGQGMQTEVIRSGKAKLFADVRARVRRPGRYYDVDPQGKVHDLSKPGAGPPGARCALMAPLKLEGRVVGIVQVMSDTEGAYRRQHLGVLEDIVAPIAVALQNAELYARAKREIAERLRVERALTLSEERLLEADRRKDEFLATLAHELRNPLAPIRNAVGVLRRGGSAPETISWSSQVVERQVGHMARLLDDLLDVSRVSRGRLRLRLARVDLAEAVRHAVEASQPLIEAGRHRLTLDFPSEPVILTADPTRLAQVFSNLLNNAARYSEAERPIEVRVRREGEEGVVCVVDQGIGIAPTMLPRIFEAFLQIDRTLERSQGGLGIGLTLVKQVVEIHGGRVEAHSDGHGKGSMFTVRLPLVASVPASATYDDGASSEGWTDLGENAVPGARAETGETGSDRSRARQGEPDFVPGRPRRILVADDLEDSATSLALLLQMQGHEVRTAHDGDEAVGIARSFDPHIVLLDIAMPKLNGYEAARRIRSERQERCPVLIALTGWGHEENRMRTKEAGFDHHLVKPVEPEVLNRLLATVETS